MDLLNYYKNANKQKVNEQYSQVPSQQQPNLAAAFDPNNQPVQSAQHIAVAQIEIEPCEGESLLAQTLRQIAGQATELLQCVNKGAPLEKRIEIAIAEAGVKLDDAIKYVKYGSGPTTPTEPVNVIPKDTAEYLPSNARTEPPVMESKNHSQQPSKKNYTSEYMIGY